MNWALGADAFRYHDKMYFVSALALGSGGDGENDSELGNPLIVAMIRLETSSSGGCGT